MIESFLAIVFVSLFLLIVGGFTVTLVAKKLVYIAAPNEVLVFSGRKSRDGKGKIRGFRTIKGGRGFRFPLIEAVDRIDLTNMTIDVEVSNAYALGGIPLTVHGVANVKVAGHDPLLSNAIERFMGKDRKQILKIAKDTLEGNLRGVLSQLTPEQVNDDKLSFAEKLLEEAEHDLSKLGLSLDTLKIQNVSDDVGFLDSIGRKQTAHIIKEARVAEAEAKAMSTVREASNHQDARLRDLEADMKIFEADAQRRIRDAQTAKDAMIAEEVGEVRALTAEAEENLKVQKARVEQISRKLEADVIAPAKADLERQQALAKGHAAKVIEDGRATVAVLNEMITVWKQGGDSARDIFLMQKLQSVMDSLVGTISDVRIDRITLLPGNGTTAEKAVTMVEELKAGIGVDVPKLLNRLGRRDEAPTTKDAE